MCDKNSLPQLSDAFRRELELINLMVSDVGEIAEELNLCSIKEELNPVVYGPLSQTFYVVNCPFVWSEYISAEDMESYITHIEEKIDLKEGDWISFCLRLYFGFLYARLGKLSDAFKQLEICEDNLSKKADDEFYKEIMDGLNHGTQATRAHLHFLNGDAELADEIISSVTPLKELGNPSKAALIAVNVEVMQDFGSELKKMALEMIKVAIQLDPDDHGSRRGAWYYTAGKLLGQLRRMEHRAGMPTQEELCMLERATKINPYSVSLAVLADSYREATTAAMFSGTVKVSGAVCTKMLSEAKQLYKRAFELDDESCSTLRRCGNGLMKLPIPHKDLQLARKCLEKAISVNPRSASAYQALGTMEEKYFKNLNAALKYFRLSYDYGNPIAGSFIVQVSMKIDRKYNPIDDLDTFIEDLQGKRPDMKTEFLMSKGEYLFFLRNDLLAAAKVWIEGIKLAPNSENVMNHVCRFVHGRISDKPYIKYIAGRFAFNVYECLECEIRVVMETPKYSDEEKALLKDVLKVCEDKIAK